MYGQQISKISLQTVEKFACNRVHWILKCHLENNRFILINAGKLLNRFQRNFGYSLSTLVISLPCPWTKEFNFWSKLLFFLRFKSQFLDWKKTPFMRQSLLYIQSPHIKFLRSKTSIWYIFKHTRTHIYIYYFR